MSKQSTRTEMLSLNKLHPFPNHPFQVKDNEDMAMLTESIRTQGVLTPLVVRPMENGEYEVISGHRRLYACQKAGIETVPALIYTLSREEAIIALVDSNLHRDHILPSEKAFAYKMKMDAVKRQGERTDLTSGQVGPKLRSDELIARDAEDSARQIKRYIRLTNLILPILQMVDESKIALTPAVELSYLKKEEQYFLLDSMEAGDCTPSYSQSIQLKKLSQAEALSQELISQIMGETKANQREKISFQLDDVRKYFPHNYNAAQIQETIMKLLVDYHKKRQRHYER